MPEEGAKNISKIIALLSVTPGEIMLVCNVCIKLRHRRYSIDDFLINLLKDNRFNNFKHHWNFNNECYKYAGNGEHSRTSMGSYIFWK
jgi:hypothetical protein